MKPVLYGFGVSVFVRKVRFLLEFKGIDYELIPVIPVDPPEGFRDISPMGKIPALKTGDFSISDSSVICQYLEKKYPGKTLLPDNNEDYAKALWFDEYADSKMTQSISAIFFEKVGKPVVFNRETDDARVAELEKQVPEVFNYLEKVLQGRDFLLGDNISFGDLGVIANLYNYKLCGYEVDSAVWPAVAAYLNRVLALPFIKNVTAKERLEYPL